MKDGTVSKIIGYVLIFATLLFMQLVHFWLTWLMCIPVFYIALNLIEAGSILNKKRQTMKTKIILLVMLVLFTVAPAQADAATFSFYRPTLYSETGVTLYNANGWTSFTEQSFDTKQNGLYTLSGDTFLTTYTGIAKITGNCRQGKPSNISLRMVVTGYAAPVVIASVNTAEAFTFSFPFVAGNFQLQGYNLDAGRYDVLKCDIVIEVLQ